jgi:hypothetical protein
VACNDGALTLDTTAAAGTVASEVVADDRSPTLTLDTTAVVETTAATPLDPSVGASSPQPRWGLPPPRWSLAITLWRSPMPSWDTLDEAMGTTHWALNQVQDMLHWGHGDINDERRCLLLWASLLKEQTTYEKPKADA